MTIDEQRLDRLLTDLEQARTWPPRVVSRLEALIRTGDDYDLFRINPIAFANERGMDEATALDLFLHGTKLGLFEMHWHMVCAVCAHIVNSLRDLSDVHSHFTCDLCRVENDVALDDYIHVSFTLSPSVRPNAYLEPESLSIEDFNIRYHFSKGVKPYGGKLPFDEAVAHLTRHMAYVAPGEHITLQVDAPPGTLHAKDMSHRATVLYVVGEPGDGETLDVALELQDGQFQTLRPGTEPLSFDSPAGPFNFPQAAQIPSGPLVVDFTNRTQKKSPLWVMHYPADFVPQFVEFEPFLSGKRLLSHQTFRDLFRGETVSASEGLAVHDITFLFTDLKGSTALYDAIGDLQAYYLVRQHFDTLTKVIVRHDGAVVKTIGDAVMASFTSAGSAVEAALEMQRELDEFNRTIAHPLILKIGIHRGHSIAVTLNDRLDYFGQTVNVAARVQALAGANEIYLTDAVRGAPGVAELLDDSEVSGEQVALRGVSETMQVSKVVPPPT